MSFAYSFYLIFGYKKASELAERKAAISQRATLRHANASLGNNKHYTGKPHDMPLDSTIGGSAVDDSEESANDFDSPGHAFVKTIVMFTGETASHNYFDVFSGLQEGFFVLQVRWTTVTLSSTTGLAMSSL